MDVLPKQDLNGYDAPWPAGGGVNKLPYPYYDGDSSTTRGVTFVSDSNGVITVSTDGASTAVAYYNLFTNLSFDAGTYTLKATGTYDVRIILSNSNNTTVAYANLTDTTFTLAESTILNAFLRVPSGTTISTAIKIYPQLEVGSTSHDWSPYSNLCPILGTDKLNLFVEESYDPSATPKASVTLGQTILGGTAEIVAGTGSEKWAEINLGDLNWQSGWGGFFATNVNVPTVGDATDLIMCESYKTVELQSDAPDFSITAIWGGIGYSSNGWLYIKDSRYNTPTDFKTAVNGIKCAYVTPEPTSYTFPPTEVSTPKGNATTWATAEDGTVDSMSVTYIGKASS